MPFTLTKRVSVNTNAAGKADVLVFPNLATSVWSLRSSAGDTSVFMYANASGDQLCGTGTGFPIDGLGGLYHKYRIVGWGLRFRPVANLATNGEIIAAPFVGSGVLPARAGQVPQSRDTSGVAYNMPYVDAGHTAEVAPTAANRLLALGVPYTGTGNNVELAIESLATYPGHGVMSHSELAAVGLHGRSKPYSPEAHSFRSLRYWNAGTDAIDVGRGATASSAGGSWGVDLSPWRIDGWTSAALGFTGYPASTYVGTLEIVYHVEATVMPSSGSDLGVRAATGVSYCDPQEYDAHRKVIAKTPHFSAASLVKQGEDLLYGTIEGMATDAATRMGNSLVGRLTSLVAGMSV